MSLDGKTLSRHERISMKLHHIVCTFCRRYTRQLKLIDAAMKNILNTSANEKLPDDARERISKNIKG